MQYTALMTQTSWLRKARSVNQTSASPASKVPTIVEPSGDAGTATGAAVIELGDRLGGAQNFVRAMFYGVGTNNQTFSCRVYGWNGVVDTNTGIQLWVPALLAEVAVVLSSTIPGVANSQVLSTELFADTITITGTTAIQGTDIDLKSPANDQVALMVLDMFGFQKLEFAFSTDSSATSCNALLAML